MEKESGEGEPAVSGKPPADPLLDAAGLFSAYWGRDGAGGGGGAGAAAAQAALFGFGSRYPAAAPSTLGVAANQAAQLGMHPAASAAWWSMASHLAAQDYLARLQASGLNFPPLGDPYSALSALSASMSLGKQPSKSNKSKTNDRSGRGSASSAKDKTPSTSAASSQSNMRSSYGFPKTSSPSSHSQPLSSLASLNSLVAQPHPIKGGKSGNASSSAQPRKASSSSSSSSTSSKSAMKERDLALFRGDLMLAQAAAQGAYHAAVAAAAKGKNISPLYPFGMGTGSEKDRHGIDSLTGLPHTILSAALEGGDPASVLGGVRLPPDTEIIKYTSSLASSKQSTTGSTSRGRKKTISLDPPQVSVHPASGAPLPSKRPKMEEYGPKSSVEVIRLGGRADRAAHAPSATPPPNLADYAGISRELLQTIASQSGVSLAALERQLAGTTASPESGLNLSRKGGSEDVPLDLGVKNSTHDEDAPLNLSLKPEPPSTQASDALSRLTSLSSSLNAGTAPSSDRISRRKPGAKPRRVLPDNAPVADSPRPKSSGSEDSESISGWSSREGRPRNLGRGVSKPKKNTVASLLAQSRALGLRPALAHQFLAEADVVNIDPEKLKTLLGETCSTDSECPSDSCPSDSDASESSRKAPNDTLLRHPIALGWKRVTVIKGLSRNCNIKGDVSYSPPEPHSSLMIRSVHELQAFLDSNACAPLTRDNFSFSPRVLLGEYVQPAAEPGETVTLGEAEITKRLEEARALAALSGARPTPPPVDKRIELARKQQAARDARRDANARSRDQARLVRELERTEKAEIAKREKEARSQQLLEHINKNRTQLTIEPVPISKIDASEPWKTPEAARNRKERAMPTISLTLIPVNASDKPITDKVAGVGQDDVEYNALDKMKDFAEKASFDIPQRLSDKYSFDFTLVKASQEKQKRTGVIEYAPSANAKENSLEKLIESYSRINEFINGCSWTKAAVKEKPISDPKSIEQNYLDAKNKFMQQNLMLMPNERQKSVLPEIIDLSDSNEVDEEISSIAKSHSRKLLEVNDATLSILGVPTAKRRKQEEMEKQKQEDQAKRQQERELKRQQAILLKEHQKYITEERERRRQHTTLIRQLDARKRWEERERRKHQNLLDRLLAKEKKLQQRRKEMELLSELRRPQEDSTLSDQKPLPNLQRIPGLKLPGQAMADVLQVFEFIHNFGQTLGFDLESVPTLNTFQTAMLPDCGPEAEEELMQVLTQLLVCAIEDPGIPHPGRHTTLLGHPIRMGDITNANISEILRIYLYANATGEVKSLTGLTAERERERRVADHHQTDAEMQVTCTSTKNAQYYEHLHSNSTYKLSETLRDKPFLALNATTKAKILAFLCNELLQNKSVLRQIDTSLENLNQLKKERYLMDMKIRKIKVLHQRKVRTEQTERQQALALERMQRMVEESTAESALTHARDEDLSTPAPTAVDHHNDAIKEALSKESSPQRDSITEKVLPPEMQSPYKDGLEKEESDKELSPLKENGLKNKELLNNNKEECSPADNKLDKDSVMGDCDAILSDLESEGTQPEEDEDKNLSSEELARKLERLLRQSEQQLQQLAAASHALRATCYGQDRYWRRYWSLGRCGGIFVEAMESAQPEIMAYHAGLENAVAGKTEQKQTRKTGKRASREKKENLTSTDQPTEVKVESQKSEDQLKSEIELKNIKSELNLSDHTQIIKYEPNLRHGACKAEGSPIKMEEKYIQHKQSKDEEDMLDIEDSIPTAFLVQKPTHKPMFAAQAENLDKPQEIIKMENVVKGEVAEEQELEESKDQLVNNLEELRKMAEAVSSQLDAAKKAETEVQDEMEKDQKEIVEPKEEIMEPEVAYAYLYTKMLEGKWFSILRKESSFLTNTNDLSMPEKYLSEYPQKIATYVDNDQTCSEIILCQGHKWDVSNNLHLLNDPSLFTLNSMVTCVPVPTNNVYTDSSLTMSGLDQDMMDASLHKENREKNDIEVLEMKEHSEVKEENDLEKELQDDALKSDAGKFKNNNMITLGLLNFNALSTYVTCDSPPPLQMSPDEIEQLEYCKIHGLPKKLEGNFVPKELRHGWWRITDPDQLRELLEALHPRGVRERELHAAFMLYLPTVNNKLYIDKGDLLSTDLSISHLDRVIAQNGGYPSPDSPGSYSAHTARRIDAVVLEMVEQLEERIAAASMQVKGWRPSRVPPPEEASGAELVARARHKLAAVEAHIERRYLKPPLVQSTQGGATSRSSTSNHNWDTTEAAIGAVLQAESHGNSSTPSPQNSESAGEGKENKGISRGLCTWREAVARCHTSAQLAMLVQALEAAVAWDKSIMKANCQFCLCGDNEDQLLLCDGCDKGYHTYCFKPRMEKIPDGDWYCWECVNKARGERVCIVCGGASAGRTIPCALCARAYHQDCHYPPLGKNPRGKWYCIHCASKAPPRKPRNSKKRESKHRDAPPQTAQPADADLMVPSPAPSHASTSTTADECASTAPQSTPEKVQDNSMAVEHNKHEEPRIDAENGLNHHAISAELHVDQSDEAPPAEKRRAFYVAGNGTLGPVAVPTPTPAPVPAPVPLSNADKELQKQGDDADAENVPLLSRAKKEKTGGKKLQKDMQFCKNLLCEMECHEHAWPFLLPVNTKQFPQYKKVIKSPMDLSTIKRKLHENSYKCMEEFASDVRLMFSNCEVFNEDDSPVGRAGHHMRGYFEQRWPQLT